MKDYIKYFGFLTLCALIPTFALGIFRWAISAQPGLVDFLTIFVFASLVLFISDFLWHRTKNSRFTRFPTSTSILFLLLISTSVVHKFTESTLSAWVSAAAFLSLLLGFTPSKKSTRSLWKRWISEITLALTAAILPVIIEQINTRFSSEEFYAAIEVFALCVFWISLRISFSLLSVFSSHSSDDTRRQNTFLLTSVVAGFLFFSFLFGIYSYQKSFYPTTAPQYRGISVDSPFLCGSSSQSQIVYDGEETFSDLIEAVDRNPSKDAPVYGFLALATGNSSWAVKFRDAILNEALNDRFADPEWSIKYDQYLVAQRVYFFAKARDAFPDLFNKNQDQKIQNWFWSINDRVHKVALVDLLYGLAFSKWPQGPYENQETGAGLLALLEAHGISTSVTSARNRDYLSANPRGWASRFRVSDDSAVYQPEFIENSLYQSMYTGATNHTFMFRSFEWMKLLAAPDGSALNFNHIASSPIADTAYLAAVMTGNTEYTWLAGRALERLALRGQFLDPQPGAEYPIIGAGKSPNVGSCLLYGQSGLPNQVGPFAPDKIVFRGGWETDDIYLLLNLRFSGWHRYKATNSIIRISQDGPLVIENVKARPIGWLPIGRSLFRDKRIPRENLNGFVVGKRGLSKVLFDLTGVESSWAQDPPFFATVAEFETNDEIDISRTTIEDWHGSDHERSIILSSLGVVIVVDEVRGPSRQSAGIVWHFPGENARTGDRIQIRPIETESPAEVVFLFSTEIDRTFKSISGGEGEDILRAQFDVAADGDLQMASVFLTRNWFGAEVSITGTNLVIKKGDESIRLSVTDFSSWQ